MGVDKADAVNPNPFEYMDMVTEGLREMLAWRARWDQRTPETERALRDEWARLYAKAVGIIGQEVEGE